VISSGIEFHEAISLSLSLRDQGIPLKAYPMKSFTRLYETVSKFSFFLVNFFGLKTWASLATTVVVAVIGAKISSNLNRLALVVVAHTLASTKAYEPRRYYCHVHSILFYGPFVKDESHVNVFLNLF
jgi:hypothetical protein